MRTKAVTFVGREVELGAALNRLRQSVDGGGAPACLCVGEPGAGKSRLVAEVADKALADGLVVMRGRASSTGSAATLRPFAEALAAIQRRGLLPDDQLGGYRPLLSRVLPRLSGASHTDTGQAIPIVAFAEAVLRVLTMIGRVGGCLLVLEDLQEADPESLAVLEYLLDNMAATPVALLGTLRDEPGSARELATAAERRGTADLLPIRPLDQWHTGRLVAACLGIDQPPDRLAELVWQNSAGNPLLVEELLHDLIDSKQLSQQGETWQLSAHPVLSPTPSMRELVGDRADRIGAAARQVLTIAAVYGEFFPLAAVLTAAGGSEVAFLDAIGAATAAQLLTAAEPIGWYRFRHPLSHQAMLQLASVTERRHAATRLAEAVLAEDPKRSATTCRVAGRLLADAGKPAAAGELYLRAGRQAVRAGAITWGVADLSEAVRLLAASRPLPSGLIGELVLALIDAGQLDRALALVARLDPATDGSERQQRALTHLDLAWGCRVAGRIEQAQLQLVNARCLVAGEDAALVRIHCEVIAACLELNRSGWIVNPVAERRARAAAEGAERAGAAEAACRAWSALGGMLRERDFDEASRCTQRIVSLADRYDLPSWGLLAMTETAYDSWIANGNDLPMRAAHEHAHQLGMVSSALDLEVNLWLHQVLVGAGNLASAVAGLTSCVEQARRLGNITLERYALAVLALAAAHRADRTALAHAQAQFEAIGGSHTYWAAVVQVASAICLALEGRDSEALAVLHEVAQRQQVGPYCLAGPHGFAVLLAIVAGVTRPQEVPAALAHSSCRQWRWNRQFLHWAAAVQAGRRGEPAVATGHAARAASDAEIYPMMRHLAARLVAPAAVADGWGTPVSDLRAAEAWFHDQGVPAAARSCRDVLRTLGAPVRQRRAGSAAVPTLLRTAGITTREYEVGLLVREHLSNRAIGARLHISPRTVEKHIAALLTKLGSPDRRTLIDRIVDGG